MAHTPSRLDDLAYETREDYQTHLQTFHSFAGAVFLFAAVALAVLALMAIVLT